MALVCRGLSARLKNLQGAEKNLAAAGGRVNGYVTGGGSIKRHRRPARLAVPRGSSTATSRRVICKEAHL